MDRPMFIIGCPRSGTTITLDLLCMHQSLAWVSHKVDRSPDRLELSKQNRIYDIPFLGKFLYLNKKKSKRLPFPVEPWNFWDTYLSRFQWERFGNIPPHRANENDITRQEIETIRKVINTICKYQNKTRFLSKYTDFPRIKYLTQAFPDAIFIHIIRDGRAVANSYYEQIKKGIFKTWAERDWWIQGWPEEWRKVWKEKYNTPLTFVTFQWKFFVDEIRKDSKFVPRTRTDCKRYPKTRTLGT